MLWVVTDATHRSRGRQVSRWEFWRPQPNPAVLRECESEEGCQESFFLGEDYSKITEFRFSEKGVVGHALKSIKIIL